MSARSIIPIFTAILLGTASQTWSQQPPPPFPDGPGKETVVKVCGACHDINRARAGYTPGGWNTLQHMMQNFATPIAPEEWPTVTAYLIKAFPERPRPPAVIIPGPVRATIKMWDVPTLGSRPHDPVATKDGAIWWTGQLVNKLGRVDPKTGTIREYLLKTPHTGPHGLVEDRSGNIWFTGNHAALIGKLDPKTGLTTEYKIPDPNVKDPHSLSFAPFGMLWFTAQNSNTVGRLNTRTGEFKLIPMPTPRSRPYGILVSPKGVPTLCLFGTNKLATIDPKTLAVKE